ncbi:MAG: hypothetical protein JSV30_02640 [Candidatus Omnitrophota bacterium]|nr:MAG: hypothetical protein JSV30_02640 [Candidatus Omnitrophota bacterium]
MNKQGLTLAEVIVSALILLVATAGVMVIFSTERAAVTGTGRRMQAMDFSRQTLEELKNAVSADTWGEAGEPLTVQGWTNYEVLPGTFGTNFSGRRRYRVDSVAGVNPSTGYRSATVEVDWQEPEIPE